VLRSIASIVREASRAVQMTLTRGSGFMIGLGIKEAAGAAAIFADGDEGIEVA
jgi:hypothetical protein